MKIEIKHTIREWSEITGVTVLDPDGFDRSDPLLWERVFTLKEFEQGLMQSTIDCIAAENWRNFRTKED